MLIRYWNWLFCKEEVRLELPWDERRRRLKELRGDFDFYRDKQYMRDAVTRERFPLP